MSNFPILSVLGIEIEYMLVDQETLDVQPKSDLLLKTNDGRIVKEVIIDDIAMSNELVMHVLELKNNGPKPPDAPIAQQFQEAIIKLQPLLKQHGLVLLPGGAHPWMNPDTETKRWHYDSSALYQQFDRIFNCQGHGWANLQSMHVNLPYANQHEFNQLHNLIRVLLPILPALAASSPILDGKPTGILDSRLYFYEKNQQRIPSIVGDVIPDFVQSEEEYKTKILKPMYKDIAPYDPDGILQHQWLNSRAAMPKFDDHAIEIRIIDSQECVNADIGIANAIHAILTEWLTNNSLPLTHPCSTQQLKQVYDAAIQQGLNAIINDREILAQWQLPPRPMTLREVWSHLIERVSGKLQPYQLNALGHIIQHGNLSERILQAVGVDCNRTALQQVYKQLANCLIHNEQFSV